MLGGTERAYHHRDDLAVTWLGVGSQIDGFGHVGIDHVHYNGWKTQDFHSLTGIKKFGVENIPPIVARGVLLDMTKYYEVDIVPNGTAFNSKEIDEVAKRQGVEIREGDVVLFHTGWLKQFAQMGEGEPGPRAFPNRESVSRARATWPGKALLRSERTPGRWRPSRSRRRPSAFRFTRSY